MKAALIPPVAHLREFMANAPLHLVLSHLLNNFNYLSFYRDQRLRGRYLILDNGAHENTAGEAMHDLLSKALQIRASEIVLPDTLFDHRATVRGAEDALEYMMGPGQDVWGEVSYPQLMLVPQGNTRDEYERCFQDLVSAYVRAQAKRPDLFTRNLTIGVSKDYDMWAGGHMALLKWIADFRSWMTFEVHLLGWARDLTVLGDLADAFPWIRSTDSAKPFVYALNDIDLTQLTSASPIPKYPRRSPTYFQSAMSMGQHRKAWRNVEVFMRMAREEERVRF